MKTFTSCNGYHNITVIYQTINKFSTAKRNQKSESPKSLAFKQKWINVPLFKRSFPSVFRLLDVPAQCDRPGSRSRSWSLVWKFEFCQTGFSLWRERSLRMSPGADGWCCSCSFQSDLQIGSLQIVTQWWKRFAQSWAEVTQLLFVVSESSWPACGGNCASYWSLRISNVTIYWNVPKLLNFAIICGYNRNHEGD